MLRDIMQEIEYQHIPQIPKITPRNTGKFSYLDDSEGIWKYVAKQSLINERESRLQKVVDGGLIHSTMLPDLCVRQVALHRRTGIKVLSDQLSYNDKIMWSIGKALEENNRLLLIERVGKSAIIGKWECGCKENKKQLIHHYNTTKYGDEEACKRCGHKPYIYQEPTIILHEYHAVCNPDLAFFNKYNKVVNWELKSIKEGGDGGQLKGFKDIESPQASNLQQALMQNLFMQLAGIQVDDYVIVNYTSKAHTGFKNPPWKEYKEFVKNHPAIQDNNKKLLEKGKVIKSMTLDGCVDSMYDTGNKLPDGNYGSKACKKCQMKALCESLRGE